MQSRRETRTRETESLLGRQEMDSAKPRLRTIEDEHLLNVGRQKANFAMRDVLLNI